MYKIFGLLFGFLACFSSIHANWKGRVDIAPARIDLDVLKSGKTERTLHMQALKGDLMLQVYQGICFKPSFILAQGSGHLATGTVAIGHYTPLHSRFVVMPCVGVTWGYLKTFINLEQIGLFHLKERFRSVSPFIGMECYYQLTDKLSLVALYQYAWSKTHTKIKPIVSEKSHSAGPNYALMLDYRWSDHFAFNVGVGYNLTLSKEKHGLRGKGIKVGFGYCF